MSAQSSSPVSNITDQSPAAEIAVPPDAEKIAANLEKQIQAQAQPAAGSQDSASSKSQSSPPVQASQAGSQQRAAKSSQPNTQSAQVQKMVSPQQPAAGTQQEPTQQKSTQTSQNAIQAPAAQSSDSPQQQPPQETIAEEIPSTESTTTAQPAQNQGQEAQTTDQSVNQPEQPEADDKQANQQGNQQTDQKNANKQQVKNKQTNNQQANDQQFQHSGDSSSFPGLLGILEANNVIDTNLAQEINNAHLNKGKTIEQLLKDSQAVTEVELIKAKAEFNNVPYIDVNDTGIAPEALNKIDESVAKRYQVLPFALDEKEQKLQVAMADPLNIPAISFIEQKTGYKLETHYGVPSEINRLISERYAQDLSGDVSAALEETSTMADRREAVMDQAQRGGFIRAAPINKIVSTILNYAIQSRASDVHIEPLQDKTRVRYRIDGILHERLILPKSVHNAVVSRIKILSDLKIDEKRVPQDGRFDYQAEGGQEIDLRVSSCPGVHGEKIVMRLLKKNQAVPALEELGLSGLALQRVRETIRIPHGIFLVTGPTGSGKTTSLYSILHIINTTEVNIITLEDPVEYQMKGVTQVQVNPQAGLTFANGLRSFLRQDPDIIMVGEIRDTETAGLAVQASLTGHLVFSTLHTNSAAGALPRLMDMEVEPFLLSSSMILAMGQRVVRRINPEYKEEYKPEPAVIEDIKKVLGKHFDDWCQKNNKNSDDITLFRPKQDRPQNEPEFKGRIGIFEVMEITDTIQSLINKQASADEIEEQAMKEGMTLMKQDGYIKVLDGITTIEEVLRVAEVAN